MTEATDTDRRLLGNTLYEQLTQRDIVVTHEIGPSKCIRQPIPDWAHPNLHWSKVSQLSTRALENMVADHTMKIQAAQRAERRQHEGEACIGLAVANTMLKKHDEATVWWDAAREIYAELQNTDGHSLALNGLALAHFELGEKYWATAIHYHAQHADIAQGTAKFIAYTNLAVTYAAIGKLRRAIRNHEHALRWAILCEDDKLQALAMANIGFLVAPVEAHTGRACMERFAQLDALRSVTPNTVLQMAKVTTQTTTEPEAQKKLLVECSLALSRSDAEPSRRRTAKSVVGIALGEQEYDRVMRTMADKLVDPS